MRMEIETVLCSAIWYDDGEVYPHQETYGVKTGFVLCGYRHHNIIGVFSTNDKFRKDGKAYKTMQGFVTSSGRFVDREQAAIIAYNAFQTERCGGKLYSEDLY